ncbi:lysylphosphatidylglycerol synthase transmembrane domain-containing protein [Flavihumibacter profundi]|uniref:lysylphosphatidylglycerol synthase transmembrane domain-containing protein n=1 Tax=Flavihumibacter profundi TaxID=2716883 RepID=UPI001CC5816B|nr:lysylphosphatidylglycerol synthase transmembrane domain-containing protein [Flavihumibacter profundi]MBZ5855623.1 flippase-like domain-containing protein [Flavihumibacter profundi]
MSVINNNNIFTFREGRVKSRSWILFFIFFLMVFGFVVYYFSEIKTEIRLLGKVDIIWLIVAVVAQILTYLFTAIIYRLLLSAQKLKQLPKLLDILKASVISLFFNQIVPSAEISGNTFIFNFLSKLNIRVAQIISLILAELLIYYAAMEAIILLLLFACLFFNKVQTVFIGTLAAGLAIYLVFGALISLAGRKKSLLFIYKKIKRMKHIKKLFENIVQTIQQQGISKEDVRLSKFLKHNKITVLNNFLVQLLLVAADVFTLFALFYGLGIHVSLFVVLLGFICARIICLIPLLPGGLILYESSMSFFFVSLGIPLGTAIIVTLIYRFLSFWAPMPIGLFLYRKWLKGDFGVIK